MTVQRRFFGTDGIRGTTGQHPITAPFMVQLGWAIGKVLGGKGSNRIIIGKDTRVSGYMLESALEAGLSAAGMHVILLGPMPTPAVAFLTRSLRAEAGIVISASHNLYQDNGIKFFSAAGTKLPDEVELAIEALIDAPFQTVDNAALGKATRLPDAPGRYIEFCKRSLAAELDMSGFKIVLDCAHGATYQVAPKIFAELGAEVIATHVHPNGFNINDRCGSTHPDTLQAQVLAEKADLGIAFDGDGDRVVMVDHQGEILDGDELLYIIAKDRLRAGTLRGGVVGTVMSNFGLELAFNALQIPFMRTTVGDRAIFHALTEHAWELGGEASGHILCMDLATTGDGIISALQVIQAMLRQAVPLHTIKQGMEKVPQKLINVPVTSRQDLSTIPAIQAAIAEAETTLNNTGRVLLRCSGTECLVRVMVEGIDKELVNGLATRLAEVVHCNMQAAL